MIQKLIEKYKSEWSKSKVASVTPTPGGYKKVVLRELGKMDAFAMILDDLVHLSTQKNEFAIPDVSNSLIAYQKWCYQHPEYDQVCETAKVEIYMKGNL